MLRKTSATWLGGGHGGERNPTLIHYPKLPGVSQVILITRHLLCVRNHVELFHA